MPRAANGRWRAGWPFVALCLLGSTRWLFEGGLPNLASTGLTEAVGCLMAAGCFLLAPLIHRRQSSNAGQQSRPRLSLPWDSCVAALILTAPALMRAFSDCNINANNATLALSLTPVVIAVATAAFGGAQGEDLTRWLWPGLAGLAGLLLLLPQPDFGSVRFTVALAGVPLLVGVAAALASRRETSEQGAEGDGSVGTNGGITLSVASLMFLALALAGRTPAAFSFSFSAAAYDGLLASLTLLVLGRLGAVRWSAQFILVPLLTLLEGVVVLKPFLDLRSWLGLGLLAGSSLYLLL